MKKTIPALFLGSLLGLVFVRLASGHPRQIPPQPLSVTSLTPSLFPTTTPSPVTGLKNAVESALSGSHGTYGVMIRNLSTGENYAQNENYVFPAASLYKLWVMAAVEQQIQQGALDENEVLTGDVAELNTEFNISPEDAELTSGSISLSVHDALTQMITISHNYSALMLTKRITLPVLASFLTANNLTSSLLGDSGNPTTTAADTTTFLTKLYHGQLGGTQQTLEMFSFLKNQELNTKLPKYLPANVTVAHKTGEIDSDSHDAGIVYSPSGDYLIVVMSETDNPDLANDRIASISRNVYQYFNP